MKNESECNVKNEKSGEIKGLRFGVRGQKKRKSISQKYKRNAKVVKTKKKIGSKLKRQLLKHYGYFVEDN